MINGKVALITGAGQGIGRGIALGLAKNCGAKLMFTPRRKAAGKIHEIPTNHNPRFAPVIHPTL